MASVNTGASEWKDEEDGPPSEHDYAHSGSGNFISTQVLLAPSTDGGVKVDDPDQSAPDQPTLSLELPEPAVGAEVDCPGGNDVEAGQEDPSKTTADSEPSVASPSPLTQRRDRRRQRRPEEMSCCGCKREFERQGRRFNRRAVYTFTSPETVHWVFPESSVHDKSFLCETCAQVIRSKGKRKQCARRSLWLKPPVAKKSQVKDKKKQVRRMGKKSQAAALVGKACYKAAFKMLWSAKGARKPMMDFWSKQLKEEMKALTRLTDSPFHQKVSNRKPLSSFPWRDCLSWAQDKAPLVTACLTSLFPDINALSKSSHQLSEEQAQTLLMRRAVVALSIPLFTRNIWKNNFLQAALGAELRLQGCSGSALDALNTMGLCQNKDTVRLLLHRLSNCKEPQTPNGRQRLSTKQEQMEDVEEEDIEEEEEEEEEEDEEEEEEEEEEEIEMAVEEEVEEEEVQDGMQDAEEEKAEMEKKRRKKKAKKQKRKERGKRKARGEEEEEEKDDDEESEQKKRRVVVVRLDLLKGHSEVGRSDLSAPEDSIGPAQ